MEKLMNFIVFGFLIAVVLHTCGGPNLAEVNTENAPQLSVKELRDQIDEYVNEAVTLKGTVVESYYALNRGMYKLQDRSGTVIITVNGNLSPKKGAKLRVIVYTRVLLRSNDNTSTTVFEVERTRVSPLIRTSP